MKEMTIVLAATLLTFAGCRERPLDASPNEPEASTTPAATAPVVPPSERVDDEETGAEPPETLAFWAAEPPVPDSGRLAKADLELVRRDGRITIEGDGFRLTFDTPELGGCDDRQPKVTSPPALPDGRVEDDAVFVALRGESESATLRLSTRGAHLLVNDGCVRSADVTRQVLGVHGDEAMFAPFSAEPPEATDAEDIRMRRLSGKNARVVKDRETIVDARYFHADPMLTTRRLGDDRWVRLTMAREYEYERHDGAIGREHTLIWVLDEKDRPTLVSDNDYRYGSDGLDREETDTRIKRYRAGENGTIYVTGRRLSAETSFRRLPDGCKTPLGYVSARAYEERLDWSIRSESGREVALGTAKLDATFATSCRDELAPRLDREHRLIRRAPDAVVHWHSPAGTRG